MIIYKLTHVFKSIEKDERVPVFLLFAHSFLNGLALILFDTTANTLFLMKYDTSKLPYVYMLTALISIICGYIYTRLEAKITITKLLKGTMLFVISIILTFLLIMKFTDYKLIYMGIMASKDILWMFIGMEFGILSGMIFNIRQGKRLFGLLLSGEIIAVILGGLSISVILNFIHTIDLLYISVVILIASLFLLHHILNRYSHKFVYSESEEKDIPTQTNSFTNIFKNRYFLLFFAVSMLAFFINIFIDYTFYFNVEANFTNEKELASFFGIFYSALSFVNLFSSLFISGLALSRFGLLFGIMVIPFMALFGTFSLLLTVMASLGVAFMIIIVLKLLDVVLDLSILNPTFKVLYQSIPVKQRMKVIALRETLINPAAIGLAGLFLLAAFMLKNVEIVYYLIIFMSLIWISLGVSLKKQYTHALEKLLSNREIFFDTNLLTTVDEGFFLNGIKSSNEVEVIYCLDALSKISYYDLDNILIKLLSHKSKKVRLYALESIEKLHKDSLTENLSIRIDEEKDPEVLNKLLNLYCKFRAVDTIEKVTKYIHDENYIIREGAIVGLLEHTLNDGSSHAVKLLNDLFSSDSKENKIIALNIVSKLSTISFEDHLKNSLQSDDNEIRSIAIKAVGNLKILEFLPDILENLELPEYKNITIQSLIKYESSIFDHLIEYFLSTENVSSQHALISVFTGMKTEESYQFLLQHINKAYLRDTIVEKLFETSYVTKDHQLIVELLLMNIKEVLFYLNVLNVLDKEYFPNSNTVIEELRDKKLENIFLVLGLYYPKNLILQTKLNYKSNFSDTRAYSVEVLDNILKLDIKKIVVPILDDVSSQKKLSSFKAHLFNTVDNQDEFFDIALIDKGIPLILKLSIIYELGKNSENNYFDQIELLTKETDPDIKQTAVWALSQLKR